MQRYLIALCLLLLVKFSNSEERRDPKWFLSRRTLTSVVLQRRLITEMIPSSCAVIEPTLQPCRNIRRLEINPSPPRKILSTEAPASPAQMFIHQGINKKAPIEPSNDGGSWLWGGVVTVTQVMVSDVTVKKQDPNTVVTFSVKGCKPTRLPFDLPLCSDADSIQANRTGTPALRTADLHYVEDIGDNH